MEKVLIITGSMGGLGKAIARRFIVAGSKVVIGDIAPAMKAAEQLADELSKVRGQSFAFQADVRSYDEMKAMVEETVKRWGRVDVVVNAAGGNLAQLTKKDNKLLLDHTEEEWDIVVDTNLKGTFNCLKAVGPQMIKQEDGHIILISSGQGIRPSPVMSSYAAAKAGVFGLMRAAAREFGKYNVKVNVVTPGFIPHRELAQGGFASDFTNRYKEETALGRLNTPEDFADFIFYLTQTKNIAGQTFNLDSRIV